MSKIKSITEAFSISPATFEITKKLSEFHNPETTLKNIEIVECVLGSENGCPIQKTCYIGFSHTNKTMFQYMCNTVNVCYDTE